MVLVPQEWLAEWTRCREGTGNLANLTPIVDSQSQFVDSLDQPLVCKDYRLLLSPQNTKSASLLEKHLDLAGALSTQHNPT